MNPTLNIRAETLNKVPAITLAFWVIKLMSTTVGETVADYLAVDAGFGQTSTRIAMLIALVAALFVQMRSSRCQPVAYWLTVVLVSVVGTQITDLMTDTLGISLYVSTAGFAVLLLLTFSLWYSSEGTLNINAIDTRKREAYYWLAILCTFALGTAAGDLATEALGLGFQLGVGVFSALIALTIVAYRLGVHPVLAFWIAYILTRPLGAALGDWLSQSQEYGGLGLGAMWTSVGFLSVISVLVAVAQRKRIPNSFFASVAITAVALGASYLIPAVSDSMVEAQAAADWHAIDKSLDRVLEALRASSPKAADCKTATTELLRVMDQFGSN